MIMLPAGPGPQVNPGLLANTFIANAATGWGGQQKEVSHRAVMPDRSASQIQRIKTEHSYNSLPHPLQSVQMQKDPTVKTNLHYLTLKS